MLEILISYHSKVPIYEQIFKQISNKILSGELPPGASLPAIRVLAKDLGVSIITVKKAYELLQSQHLINSVVGKGTIVSKLSSDFIEDSIRKQLEKKIDEVIEEWRLLLDTENMHEMRKIQQFIIPTKN